MQTGISSKYPSTSSTVNATSVAPCRRHPYRDATQSNHPIRLGYLDEIPVCIGYEIDGKVTKEFPATYLLEKAKPVYKVLPGWKCDITGIRNYEELPKECREYVEFVEKELGFPITMVSNGPGREDIIFRKSTGL